MSAPNSTRAIVGKVIVGKVIVGKVIVGKVIVARAIVARGIVARAIAAGGSTSRSIAGAPCFVTMVRSSASTRPAPATFNRAKRTAGGRPRGGRRWPAAACSKARWVGVAPRRERWAADVDKQASSAVEDRSVADRPREAPAPSTAWARGGRRAWIARAGGRVARASALPPPGVAAAAEAEAFSVAAAAEAEAFSVAAAEAEAFSVAAAAVVAEGAVAADAAGDERAQDRSGGAYATATS